MQQLSSQQHYEAEGHASLGTQLLAALAKPIVRVRLSTTYRLALVLVALMMLLLPLVYVGLIALVCSGFVWYATHAVVLVNRGGRFGIAAFITPLMAGLLLIIFMIKPLFARRQRKFFPLSVTRADQPIL